MAMINLALRFLLELAGVGALAYAGWQVPGGLPLRIVAAVGAPLVLVTVWGLVIAPNAESGLSQAQKNVVGTLALLVAAAALAWAGPQALAAAFAIVIVINAALLFILGDAGALTEPSR